VEVSRQVTLIFFDGGGVAHDESADESEERIRNLAVLRDGELGTALDP